ncbi:MAG: hypothetical protein JNM58_01080 [Xanthomonadaceae bacterium]|nr:hypothetical protein [Xanthomonadaceae bacterium]
MSNVIRFLEQAAQGRYGKSQMEAVISSLDVDPTVRKALAEGDLEMLANSIGGRAAMRCMVMTPD